jgi:hypothetical protein
VTGRWLVGRVVSGRVVLGRGVLGRVVLGRVVLGRVVLGRVVLGRVVLGRVVLAALAGSFGLAGASTTVAAAATTRAESTSAPAPSVTGPSVVSGPRVAAGVQSGPNRLDLLGQSTDVEAGQAWQIHLEVSAAAPASDRLTIEVYDRLTTRTGFDASLSGRMPGSPIWRSGTMDVTGLPSDAGGGVTLAIPVDEPTVDEDLPEFYARTESGIYPLQVRLLDGSSDTVSTLTTYLLYVAGTPSQTGFPKLDVSLSLGVHAAPALPSVAPPTVGATPAQIAASAGRPSAGTIAALGSEVAALRRHPSVPLSLTVTPQTADMLAATAEEAGAQGAGEQATARAALAGLSQLVAGGDELLPTTWVATSLPALEAAGLSADIGRQFAAGSASLANDLHQAPETGTWVVDGPLEPSTLELLQARGATKLIVPASDLRALPKAALTFTVATPAQLSSSAGGVTVDAADPQLSAHFSNSGDQILAANQLLAELAMIQLETPSRARGVAVLPPPGWVPNIPFLDTVLGGLTANPLLQAVTADQLFAGVPLTTSDRSKVIRALAPTPPPAPLSGAATVKLARTVADGFGAVLPQAPAVAAELSRRILISESSDLSSGQRSEVLGSVVAAATPLNRGISLPGGTSITLTARKGNLPLTILDEPSLRAHVQLRLSSDKLVFESFSPPGGHCTQISTSSESCQLVLSAAVTTIKVPVEARTSGVFTLDVTVLSPDGGLSLASNRDTVRSTAVSEVGVVLIVLAALGLGYWWFRNIRHGRRARQLVTVVEGSGGDGAATMGEPVGEGVEKEATGDDHVSDRPAEPDVFADFFSTPAPQYPTVQYPTVHHPTVRHPIPSSPLPPVPVPPVSPSRGGAGPST